MAEGLLRHAAGDRYDVHSAGTEPKGVSPHTVEAMREIGIDVSGQRSKSVDEYAGQSFDYVITVCDSARQACPAFPGRGKRLHWDVEDPAVAEERGGSAIEAFRAARDDLRQRVDDFALRAEGPAKAALRLPWRRRPALFWRILRDPRVPLPAKLVLPAMGLYLVIPLDPIPDFIPVIGYLDDLLVVVAGLRLFLRLCPAEVFWDNVRRLEGGRAAAD
jgi:arsenate reductase